jgi:hypothetical protein
MLGTFVVSQIVFQSELLKACIVNCAAYMSSPCHIELTLSEKEAPVKKEVGFAGLPYFFLELSCCKVGVIITLVYVVSLSKIF